MPLTHIDDIFSDSLPQKPIIYKIFTKTHAQNRLAAWVLGCQLSTGWVFLTFACFFLSFFSSSIKESTSVNSRYTDAKRT